MRNLFGLDRLSGDTQPIAPGAVQNFSHRPKKAIVPLLLKLDRKASKSITVIEVRFGIHIVKVDDAPQPWELPWEKRLQKGADRRVLTPREDFFLQVRNDSEQELHFSYGVWGLEHSPLFGKRLKFESDLPMTARELGAIAFLGDMWHLPPMTPQLLDKLVTSLPLVQFRALTTYLATLPDEGDGYLPVASLDDLPVSPPDVDLLEAEDD